MAKPAMLSLPNRSTVGTAQSSLKEWWRDITQLPLFRGGLKRWCRYIGNRLHVSVTLYRNIKQISHRLVVTSLSVDENQVETKHVETLLFPRVDEGSTPSKSTKFHILPFCVVQHLATCCLWINGLVSYPCEVKGSVQRRAPVTKLKFGYLNGCHVGIAWCKTILSLFHMSSNEFRRCTPLTNGKSFFGIG